MRPRKILRIIVNDKEIARRRTARDYHGAVVGYRSVLRKRGSTNVTVREAFVLRWVKKITSMSTKKLETLMNRLKRNGTEEVTLVVAK